MCRSAAAGYFLVVSSLTRPAAPSPFDVESPTAIFCRLMLRVAVVAGAGCAALVWDLRATAVTVVFLVATASLTAVASCRSRPGRDALEAGLVTAQVAVAAVAALAVVDVAGTAGLLAVALCIPLSARARRTVRAVAGRRSGG